MSFSSQSVGGGSLVLNRSVQQQEARAIWDRAEHDRALRALELYTKRARATLEVVTAYAEVDSIMNLDDAMRTLSKEAIGKYMLSLCGQHAADNGGHSGGPGRLLSGPLHAGHDALTVGMVAQSLGLSLTPEQLVSVGHRIATEYREKYHASPPKRELPIGGGVVRRVCCYTERDRPLLERHVRETAASLAAGTPSPKRGVSPRAALAAVLSEVKDANDSREKEESAKHQSSKAKPRSFLEAVLTGLPPGPPAGEGSSCAPEVDDEQQADATTAATTPAAADEEQGAPPP